MINENCTMDRDITQIITDLNASNINPININNSERHFLDINETQTKNELNITHTVKQKIIDGKCIKMWECGICHKEFGHQYILMRHLPIHTGERKFQCNTCGKAFRQMSTLSQHRAIHSSERPYICSICQKTFNRISTLMSHKRTHTGIKPHQCKICNKAFYQKGNLRSHIFTHTDLRPYKCDVCERGFNQMSNLMCHKMKIHRQTEKTKFSCDQCGKEFFNQNSLRKHVQYGHDAIDNGIGMIKKQDQKLENVIYLDAIKTKKMQQAFESNYVPFALLKPLNGMPVIVKILPTGTDKDMMVPVSSNDLKKFAQISVVNIKSDDQTNICGSKVYIKVPIVATIAQKGDGKENLGNQFINSTDDRRKVYLQTGQTDCVCDVCGREFMEKIDLIAHEQYEHNGNYLDGLDMDKIVYLDAIKTAAMQEAVESNRVPFALFRPLNGQPVIVKIIPTGGVKDIMVPVCSDDLKTYGEISVTEVNSDGENDKDKPKGPDCKVSIKVPIVATIIQKTDGKCKMSASMD